jgi:hypothetical protein
MMLKGPAFCVGRDRAWLLQERGHMHIKLMIWVLVEATL